MINALFKVIFGLIEFIIKAIWWIIKTMFFGSNVGRIMAVVILIFIWGGLQTWK